MPFSLTVVADRPSYCPKAPSATAPHLPSAVLSLRQRITPAPLPLDLPHSSTVPRSPDSWLVPGDRRWPYQCRARGTRSQTCLLQINLIGPDGHLPMRHPTAPISIYPITPGMASAGVASVWVVTSRSLACLRAEPCCFVMGWINKI